MTQEIFIGIDGGGTKTNVRIEDSKSHLLAQGIGGPSNIRISVDGAWDSINQALQDAFQQAGISSTNKNFIFHVGMGLAGCEDVSALQLFLSRPHFFKTLSVKSDSHIACIGAHAAQDGAIIIIGTGVVGYQTQARQFSKVGGWGFPIDDEGGGAWLGMQVARLVFQWLDSRIEKTSLLAEVFDYFNGDFHHFFTWVHQATATEFAQLAPLVIRHYQQEEIIAVDLIKKAALAVDKIGMALEKMQADKTKGLLCCLCGGIAPFVEPWLSASLRSRLTPKKLDATEGAILMVRHNL